MTRNYVVGAASGTIGLVGARTRKEILGQWGVRGENDRERLDRERLERDLEGSPLAGRPLRQRWRNFRPAVDGYVVSLGGPLPYMVRLKEIEARTEEHLEALEASWLELSRRCDGDPGRFAREWRGRAERWSFDEVNDLIDRHNRFYPAEARLPMDVRRRDFVHVNGEHYSRRPLDAAWALERFPPELPAATASRSAAAARSRSESPARSGRRRAP